MTGDKFTERLLAAQAATPAVTEHPAPGYDAVEGASEDVPDELAFERAVAEEAGRRTALAFPHAAPGYIDPRIREKVRREMNRERTSR